MVRPHALSSYQASWPDHERAGSGGARQVERSPKWRAALVGVLLASAAGYAYRQLAPPVAEPEDTPPEVAAADFPAPPLAGSTIFRVPVLPVEAPVAVTPVAPRVPMAARQEAAAVPARSKFDEVFGIDRSAPRAERAAAPVETVLAEVAVPAGNLSPVDAVETSAGSEQLADAGPAVAPTLAGDNDAFEVAVSAEPGLSGDIAGVDLASVEPAPAPELAPVQADGVELAAANVPLSLEENLTVEAGPELAAVPPPTTEAPISLAAVAPELIEPPVLRAERAIPRRAEGAVIPAPVMPVAPVPQAAAPVQAESPAPAAYVQRFPVVVLNGAPLGAITVREFADERQQIHLGALLSLFKLRMPAAEYERLIGSVSADQFVGLEVLEAAGLEARYDARRGRLVVGSRGAR